jgi:hypothetical protein
VSVAYINDQGYSNMQAQLFHAALRGDENNGPLTKTHNKGIIVDGDEVLICSINAVENSFKGNREAGVIIENSTVADWYRDVFLNDWYGPSLPDDLSADGHDVIADGGKILPALVINEVMSNPDGSTTGEDQDEFIEIFNDSINAIDVADYNISDGDATDQLQAFEDEGDTTVLPGDVVYDTTVIPSGGYALIMDQEYAGTYNDTIPANTIILSPDDTTIGNGLQTNDPITLSDVSGDVIDAWTSPFNPGDGYSAERKADGTWTTGPYHGTPGDANENNKP